MALTFYQEGCPNGLVRLSLFLKVGQEITLNQSGPQTDAEYEAAIEHSLAEIKRLREQMDEDQQEIDRLKAETQAILAELRTL